MPKSPDISTIVQSGEQMRLTIPKPFVAYLKLQPGQQVQWKVVGNRIELRPL